MLHKRQRKFESCQLHHAVGETETFVDDRQFVPKCRRVSVFRRANQANRDAEPMAFRFELPVCLWDVERVFLVRRQFWTGDRFANSGDWFARRLSTK